MPGNSRIHASSAARTFVLGVFIVIILLEIWSAVRERDVDLTESTHAMSNAAMAIAQHADQTFNEVDIVLLGIIERLERDGYSQKGLERTHDLMVMRVGGLPQLAGLFAYDEHGEWIVNSQPMLETRFNNADRDYFVYHRNHRTEKAFIGKPIQSKSTGQWILTISRRINKMDGSFGGVVLGTIDLSYLERFYGAFDIGRDGAIMLGTLDGTILHQRPLWADFIGKGLDNSSLFRDHVKREVSGSVEIRSPQDGLVRINSFQHLSNPQLFVVVAMAKDEVLEGWTRHAWFRAAGILLLLITLGYDGIRVVVQVRQREAAELKAIRAKTKIEELYRVLEAQSQKDGLTAAFNRRYFDDTLAEQLERIRGSGGSLSLIMVDVDHFKKFNDTYGHAAGDVCLRRVAAAIQRAAQRKCDVVARYGGEEFAVILPDCGKAGALAVAQSLKAHLHEENIPHWHSHTGTVTASVGVTSLDTERRVSIKARELIEAADEGLYAAKNQGRNQIVFRDFSVYTVPDINLGATTISAGAH